MVRHLWWDPGAAAFWCQCYAIASTGPVTWLLYPAECSMKGFSPASLMTLADQVMVATMQAVAIFADYGETKLRHFHALLEEWIQKP